MNSPWFCLNLLHFIIFPCKLQAIWLQFMLPLKFDSPWQSWMLVFANSYSFFSSFLLRGFDLSYLHLPSDLEPGLTLPLLSFSAQSGSGAFSFIHISGEIILSVEFSVRISTRTLESIFENQTFCRVFSSFLFKHMQKYSTFCLYFSNKHWNLFLIFGGCGSEVFANSLACPSLCVIFLLFFFVFHWLA